MTRDDLLEINDARRAAILAARALSQSVLLLHAPSKMDEEALRAENTRFRDILCALWALADTAREQAWDKELDERERTPARTLTR